MPQAYPTSSYKRTHSTPSSVDSESSYPRKRQHCIVHQCPRTCPTRSRELIKRMRHKVILRGKFQLQRKLGRGSFGVTYRAEDMLTRNQERSELCAAKIQTLGCHQSSKERQTINNEVNMLQKVTGHEYVVNFRGFFVDRYYAYLFMDYYHGPTLEDAINKKLLSCYDEGLDTLKGVFLQLLDGVEFIHSKNVAHCDLKPENIILDDSVKIIDFGLATDQPRRSRMVGTYEFMAPEIFTSNSWDCKMADNWSLGTILLFMLVGYGAWWQANESDERFLYYINNRNDDLYVLRQLVPELPAETAVKLREILNPNPNHRPSLNTIREILWSIT